jgi:hypothetical protein
VEHDSVERASLEARIRSGFGMHFDACIEGFMPRFAYYRHASGATGVIGFRCAADEPLFLESYLNTSVESVIADETGALIGRDRIAEVGQFVVDDLPVASAEAARARDTGDRWGRYYDFDPVVILGKLDDPQGRWCGGSLAAAKAS